MHKHESSLIRCISYALFCNKKLNRRIVRFKKNWDEVVGFTCGPGNHRKGR